VSGEQSDAVRDPARLAALRDSGLLAPGADESFDRFTRLACDVLGVEMSLVSLLDAERHVVKSFCGPAGPLAEARETPLTHSFCKLTVELRRVLVVDDTRADPRVADNLAIRDFGILTYAGIPLTLPDGHTLGTLCAMGLQPRAWTDRDVRVLTGLGAAVVAEIELRRALTATSLRDPLTGLANRLFFRALLDHELAGARGAAPELAVLSLGIDDFRLVNESLGHLAGDELLKEIARRLSRDLREGDALCRFSGDQFLLLCRGVPDGAAAERVAERARDAIARAPVVLAGAAYRVRATAGIALPDGAAHTAEELVTAADAAMREAKAQGRAALSAQREASRAAAGSRLKLHTALAQALEEHASRSTTSRSSRSPRASPSPRRRWRAGRTPSSAGWRPTSSSPPRSAAGGSRSSASGCCGGPASTWRGGGSATRRRP
jgi:diguanylate cyclase (GGDEF)-like protein